MKYLDTARRQRGVALLVALMILVIVSLMGITAMKTSMFSSKISTGTQVDAMSFEGAESAVEDAFGYLYTMSSAELQPFLNGQVMQRCLTASGVSLSACQNNDRMDSRGLVRAGSRTRQKGMQSVSGGQVSMTGSGSMIVDYTFEIMGDSEIEQFEVDDHHLQQALKRGMVASSDFNNIGQE
ncbi:hypothetical protein LL252_09645 [Alcanivorax marinus]|uniref:Type 4 fimbrial biogenesis protein PilX N-terminal domain-containing protein n=1 Tax=Alloalcanivorax marinus TaxID=1177169 RepID=A0A9Q3UMQ3_9GAMM|nr:PilX N-terminal domain-containing pilus assembly protein [Alloalcanivorax marinus]MCC4308831.1 hypothetical protein [Alloalcanivorax marinus]